MDIIHHNETFEVDAFFAGLKSSYIGIDAEDYKTFLTQGNEVHTFIGQSDNDNRVLSAIEIAIGSEKVKSLISNASAVLMVIFYSKESNRPLSMTEIQNISKAFEDFKEETNVVWSVSDDDSMGDFIKVVVLVNIRK